MLRKLELPLLGLVFCLCAGCAINPITGKEELMLVSLQQDIEIGRRYAPEIEKQMGGRIADQELQNYIDGLGQSIVRVSHNHDFEYHFVALNDKSVNAFALPGGYVFITKGMLENLTTEDQLAGILAHETVHIVARDTSNMMSNQIGIDLLLSVVTSEQTPRSVLTAAELTRRIIGLKYSKEDECVADLGGMDYMVSAGYNPYGMVETMQMLQDRQQSRPIEFLSTHPSPENRITYLKEKIRSRYYGLERSKVGAEDYRRAVLERLSD